MRVQFLIGGTQKGGTSALDAYLREHPQLSMAKVKEVHFFDNEVLYRSPPIDYSLYHENFDHASTGKIFGEATPIYMFWRPAPQRIWEYNPGMKWILLLRNPIERAYSQWNMEFRRGSEELPFIDALFQEKLLLQRGGGQHRVSSYVSRGRYVEQIRHLLQFFPFQQLHILKSEELTEKPGESLSKIYNFLGVDDIPPTAYEKIHVGQYSSKLTDAQRSYLREIFEQEIHSLEQLLGWNCDDWLR